MTDKEPKTYTAAEIVKMVNDKRQSKAFQDLYDQMDRHFELYQLVNYKPEIETHQSYTSPGPRNDFMKVFHGVNKAALTWRIVTAEDAPEDERKKANKGEGLLTGIFDRTDRQLVERQEAPLRSGSAWFACGRGMLALKCLIYPDEEAGGEITTDICSLDPYWIVWEQGRDGMVWFANIYHLSKAEAKERYGITIEDELQEPTVIDFWTRKENAVVLYSGSADDIKLLEFVKEPKAHGLKRIPIFIGFSSGMPMVREKDGAMALKERAASVYASSEKVYNPRNKLISFLLDTAEKSVAGTLVMESETGTKQVQGDPFGSWKVITLKTGEKLYPLEAPKAPPVSEMLLGIEERDLQQSTVPFPIGYGLDPQSHSGTALAMMNDNTKSIYGPFTSLIEQGWTWLCEEMLGQFKTKGQKMKLRGFDSKGKFFNLEANPEDIQDDWYIKVKCEPKLPRDEAAEMQMALAATQPRSNGRPLLTDYTAYEKILQLQDPDAEIIRIDEQLIKQKIEMIPNLMLRKMALSLLKKGDKEGAMELLSMMPSPQGAQGATLPSEGAPPQGMEPPPEIQAILSKLPPEVVAVIMEAKRTGKQLPPEIQAIVANAEMQARGGI